MSEQVDLSGLNVGDMVEITLKPQKFEGVAYPGSKNLIQTSTDTLGDYYTRADRIKSVKVIAPEYPPGTIVKDVTGTTFKRIFEGWLAFGYTTTYPEAFVQPVDVIYSPPEAE